MLFIFPAWGVISTQLAYLFGNKNVISGSRYLLILSLLMLLLVKVALSLNKVILNYGLVLLFFYLTYVLMHVLGDTEIILIIEGFRHELLFVIISFLLLLIVSGNPYDFSILPYTNTVMVSVFVNGSIAVLFAIWQYVDVSILELLYGMPLEDIGNISLAIGYRLTSIFANPINFGAYMCMLFLVASYFYNKSALNVLLYMFVVLVALIMVVGSLSRLSLIAFVVIFILTYALRASYITMLFGFISIAILSVLVLEFVDIELIVTRFGNIFEARTYLENARVVNWITAFSSLSFLQYFWGRGIGASSPDSSIYQSTSAMPIENGFLTIAYQYGVVGLLLFLIVLFRFFIVGLTFKKYERALYVFIISFVCFYIIMSMGNDFIRNSPFSLYFWFYYVYFELFLIKSRKDYVNNCNFHNRQAV
ncbi:O-antigen ligase family protein [Saccharospirillum alexandrii]|uniref:O-antigen ligase family protein n=1 Tax=Saccharospirillum alexandrii TaxID=2448477 RepID=UPI0037362B53